jgi:hypothetical protein
MPMFTICAVVGVTAFADPDGSVKSMGTLSLSKAIVVAGSSKTSLDVENARYAQTMLDEGRKTFRYETFDTAVLLAGCHPRTPRSRPWRVEVDFACCELLLQSIRQYRRRQSIFQPSGTPHCRKSGNTGRDLSPGIIPFPL